MVARPPDETIGTAAATELYDLLRIAAGATRIATWAPSGFETELSVVSGVEFVGFHADGDD